VSEEHSKSRRVKLAALVLTPHLLRLKEWLEIYFGFTAIIDCVDTDWSGGLIFCRRADDEISLVGISNDSQPEHRVVVVLLVEDIESLCRSFDADGIVYSFSRDIGYRPTVDFDQASPFAMFQIEEFES
jgi:hypothetical protein